MDLIIILTLGSNLTLEEEAKIRNFYERKISDLCKILNFPDKVKVHHTLSFIHLLQRLLLLSTLNDSTFLKVFYSLTLKSHCNTIDLPHFLPNTELHVFILHAKVKKITLKLMNLVASQMLTLCKFFNSK